MDEAIAYYSQPQSVAAAAHAGTAMTMTHVAISHTTCVQGSGDNDEISHAHLKKNGGFLRSTGSSTTLTAALVMTQLHATASKLEASCLDVRRMPASA